MRVVDAAPRLVSVIWGRCCVARLLHFAAGTWSRNVGKLPIRVAHPSRVTLPAGSGGGLLISSGQQPRVPH